MWGGEEGEEGEEVEEGVARCLECLSRGLYAEEEEAVGWREELSVEEEEEEEEEVFLEEEGEPGWRLNALSKKIRIRIRRSCGCVFIASLTFCAAPARSGGTAGITPASLAVSFIPNARANLHSTAKRRRSTW